MFSFVGYAPKQDDIFVFLTASAVELGEDVVFEVEGLEPGFEFGVAVNPGGSIEMTALNDGEIADLFFSDGFELLN